MIKTSETIKTTYVIADVAPSFLNFKSSYRKLILVSDCPLRFDLSRMNESTFMQHVF